MEGYNGPMRNVTDIHHALTRKRVADILRMLRKGGIGQGMFSTPRGEAREYRDWLIYLGTFPLKPNDDTVEWAKRMQNKTRAFLSLYKEKI